MRYKVSYGLALIFLDFFGEACPEFISGFVLNSFQDLYQDKKNKRGLWQNPIKKYSLASYVHNHYICTYFNKFAMDTKLTIKLDKNIIEKAKKYARRKNISLSKMIESYLNTITRESKPDIEISPLVKSLSGVISLPDNFDFKTDYTEYLSEKY